MLEDGEEVITSFCVLKVKISGFINHSSSDYLFKFIVQVLIPKHFKPPRFLEDLRVFLGETGNVSLECKVIGIPQPTLKWFKDDKELKAGDLHQLTAGAAGAAPGASTASSSSDSKTSCVFGVYKCEAENCMGTAVSMATLIGLSKLAMVSS